LCVFVSSDLNRFGKNSMKSDASGALSLLEDTSGAIRDSCTRNPAHEAEIEGGKGNRNHLPGCARIVGCGLFRLKNKQLAPVRHDPVSDQAVVRG
jgi:hypothetical protein